MERDRSKSQKKRKADEADLNRENNPCKAEHGILGNQNGTASGEPEEQSLLFVSPSSSIESQSSTKLENLPVLSAEYKKLNASLKNRFKLLDYSHKSSNITPRLWILIELYIFATQFCIEALSQKALSSIHTNLLSGINRISRHWVVKTIRYMYGRVLTDEMGEKCSLHKLCIWYAVCHAEFLHRDEEFEGLLRSNPDFAVDFVRALAE